MRCGLLAGAMLAIAAIFGVSIAARDEGLSPRRVAALAAVGEVVPAVYGEERFARLAPGYSPEILKKFPTFTTCGYLPAFIARQLGARGRILQAGTNLLRDEGRTRGAWVEWRPGRLPKPGDLYALVNAAGGVVHVGVVVAADHTRWETADAGQGTRERQRTERVIRAFNSSMGALASGTSTKRVGGWIDIDAFPFGEDI